MSNIKNCNTKKSIELPTGSQSPSGWIAHHSQNQRRGGEDGSVMNMCSDPTVKIGEGMKVKWNLSQKGP